ncbi:hypothetical protein ACFV2V_12530 [Streptomyces sp. NPDC059698]|uniref:hypothetical protein n=1 Tax=unclassified Streptomyces TaxID=2593676 RepID=UPI00116105E7|nr:hypothetical protein [Streptomyces sp. CB02366]
MAAHGARVANGRAHGKLRCRSGKSRASTPGPPPRSLFRTSSTLPGERAHGRRPLDARAGREPEDFAVFAREAAGDGARHG